MNRLFVFIALAAIVAFAILQYRDPGSDAARAASYAMSFATLVAAGMSLGSASLSRQDKHTRLMFRWLAIGAFVWSLASILEFFELRIGQPTYGTIADCFWGSGYISVLIAMIRAVRGIREWKVLSGILPCILWILSATLVFLLVLLPIIPQVDRKLLVLIGVSFYWFDVFLVSTAILVCSSRQIELRASCRLLLLAFFILYICDLVISIYFRTVTPLAYWLNLAFVASYWMLYFSGKLVLRTSSVRI